MGVRDGEAAAFEQISAAAEAGGSFSVAGKLYKVTRVKEGNDGLL